MHVCEVKGLGGNGGADWLSLDRVLWAVSSFQAAVSSL